MTKQELRKAYLEKREALTESEYFHLNHLLCEQFFVHIDLSFVKVIHTFLPITEKREPDTWLIIDRIRREFPHVRLSIPRVNPQQNTLENYFFEGLHQLEKNSWGILEPRQGVPAPPEKLDMVLVPLLAFDKEGHRVGYGKGYYDKLLSTCNNECQTIGLSLSNEPEIIDDLHPKDIALKYVLTPQKLHTF